jgi:glycosyltransferase involved in cell wall biosynthesis
MKISVAIPSYNYAQYIGACLSSIQSQSYPDFEVLIADGGSGDGSLDIIEEYCRNDSRFRLVSRKDDGQPDAVCKALDLAVGDIQCFLNADDIYLSTSAFSMIIEAFKTYQDASVISAGGYYIDSAGRYLKPVRLRYHPLDNISWMKYRTACLQPATFWKKHVYQAIGFRREFHYSFDSVFFYEAYNRYSWLELEEITAGYRLHGVNKSVQVKSVRIKELAKCEEIKFGGSSFRVFYLLSIAAIARIFEESGSIGRLCNRMLYRSVNSLAFVSGYRLPGI